MVLLADMAIASRLPERWSIASTSRQRTTKLYDRTSDEIALDEIERILI